MYTSIYNKFIILRVFFYFSFPSRLANIVSLVLCCRFDFLFYFYVFSFFFKFSLLLFSLWVCLFGGWNEYCYLNADDYFRNFYFVSNGRMETVKKATIIDLMSPLLFIIYLVCVCVCVCVCKCFVFLFLFIY